MSAPCDASVAPTLEVPTDRHVSTFYFGGALKSKKVKWPVEARCVAKIC
jgi:hypothetical protein